MYFNIYLDDETAKRLQQATESSNKSRNLLIRQAIAFWLDHTQKKKWSDEILDFKGVTDFPAFENNRKELSKPKEDPLA